MSIKHKGYKYRQNDSSDKWLFSFVASCDEVKNWAGIPRKSDENVEGFQRPENPERIIQITEYFSNVQNVSPTSIILGLHQEPSRITIEDLEEINPNLYYSEITINFDECEKIEDAVKTLKLQIDSRMTQADEEETPDNEQIIEDADDDEDESMGTSVLKKLRENLDDPDWCKTHETHLKEMAKPATIIDGQHRIEGASVLESDIHFNFTALIDCGWDEQVFQFTAINYTSHKIKDAFITANAALSLTKSEMEKLSVRLEQAKVKVTEHTLMETVNFNADSPFYELVDLGSSTPTPDNKLGYKTMVAVSKVWYNATHNALKTKILPKLYPSLTSHTARKDAWQNDNTWAEYFLIFWNAVYDVYNAQKGIDGVNSIWTVNNSPLLKQSIVLKFFQDYALNHLSVQSASVFNTEGAVDEHLRKVINETITEFSTTFNNKKIFAKEWGQTSLSTGAGKNQLKDLFVEVTTSSGEYNFSNHPVVKGN